MPNPGSNHDSTAVEGTSFEPVQSLLLDESKAEWAETKSGLVLTEARSHHHIYEAVRVTRSITVAILDTQVRHSQQGKIPQVRVSEVCGRHEFREDFHHGP